MFPGGDILYLSDSDDSKSFKLKNFKRLNIIVSGIKNSNSMSHIVLSYLAVR